MKPCANSSEMETLQATIGQRVMAAELRPRQPIRDQKRASRRPLDRKILSSARTSSRKDLWQGDPRSKSQETDAGPPLAGEHAEGQDARQPAKGQRRRRDP